jgi:hypothetical protein
MPVLAFHPEHNSPLKKDMTGAFRPEAVKWCHLHGGAVRTVNCKAAVRDRRTQLLVELKAYTGPELDAVGFFCHGARKSFQVGFSWDVLDALAEAIVRISKPDVRVALYACNCASGNAENFASRLRDALCKATTSPVQVDGHEGRGHCTYRPYVKRYTEPSHSGGRWLITPGTPLWKKWVNALYDTDARFQYPFVSTADIKSLIPLQDTTVA